MTHICMTNSCMTNSRMTHYTFIRIMNHHWRDVVQHVQYAMECV